VARRPLGDCAVRCWFRDVGRDESGQLRLPHSEETRSCSSG
jgi:hypothetical protein